LYCAIIVVVKFDILSIPAAADACFSDQFLAARQCYSWRLITRQVFTHWRLECHSTYGAREPKWHIVILNMNCTSYYVAVVSWSVNCDCRWQAASWSVPSDWQRCCTWCRDLRLYCTELCRHGAQSGQTTSSR